MKKILVTGGAGFIGSALIRNLLQKDNYHVLNIDKLTYSGNLQSLSSIPKNNYTFKQADICQQKTILSIIQDFKPNVITHLAAETHVDRSIDSPKEFIQTNILGTYSMLEASRNYYDGLSFKSRKDFLFHHISTDEVFGSLGKKGYFKENSPYDPKSPYSSSKASSDHLVRAWNHTFDIPCIVTNCSNNYGPYQYPEKLIPLMIYRAITNQSLPIYGKGDQVRDWLYVDDHVSALKIIFEKGREGSTYNIGGNNEEKNINVVRKICSYLDKKMPKSVVEVMQNKLNLLMIDLGMISVMQLMQLFSKMNWAGNQTRHLILG